MPRTRNITRAQWDAANASNSTTTGDQNHNHGSESEKENKGRPTTRHTRSQTRSGRNGNRVLGSTTTASLRINTTSKGPQNTASANASKVKGKGKAKAPPPKRKKLPLQDITSQFLPAPEAANRGEGNEAAEHSILQQTENSVNFLSPLPLARILRDGVHGNTMSMNHATPRYLDSPLPPSSPPSAITSSPQYPKIPPNPNISWLGLSSCREENNLQNEFDDRRPASHGTPSVMSSSDPFGFVALERKLKVERRAAATSPLKRHYQQDESDEELDRVLVADTSSPHLVPRLKRPKFQGDSALPPAISENPHYATPPTPHKVNKTRPRLSHEEDGVFSPSPPALPSTPSPSKPPVQKRGQELGREDTLGVFGKARNRSGRGIVKDGPSTTSKTTMTPWELRASLDDDAETEEQTGPKRAKTAKFKNIPTKSRSTGAKKTKKEKNAEKNDKEDDYAEKWERERQERAAYFKRLERYQVEQEDVYVI